MGKVICIIGADPYSRNYGIRALYEGLLRVGLSTFPGADMMIVVGSSRSRTDFAKSCSLDNCKEIEVDYSKNIYRKNHILRLILLAILFRSIPIKKIKRLIMSANSTFRYLYSTDAIFSISAGDSFSDLYGLSNLIYVSLPQIFFIIIGKPIYQMPQSYGPFTGILARGIARFILFRSKAVLVRELISKKYLLNVLTIDKTNFCYDLGFLMKDKMPNTPWSNDTRDGLRIGFNISGMLFFGGYEKKEINPFNLMGPYCDTVFKIIEFLMKREEKINLFLVPHVPGEHFQSDQKACTLVFDDLKGTYPGRIHLIDGNYDHREMKYIIGKMDFFIGSRMHACIASISQSVPTASLAYSDKFLGVMKSIDYQDSVLDLRCIALPDIRSRIEAMLKERRSDRERIRTAVNNISPEIERTFRSIIQE